MKVGYVRVSTVGQNDAIQIKALECKDIEKWFIDKASGKDTNRPQLQAMLEFIREGDTIFVYSFDRLARNTKDLLELVEFLNNKEVALVSSKEGIDTSTPTGKLMLTMIGVIAEFERANILERQREGIAIAKAEGKYKGRKEKKVDEAKFEELCQRYMRREITKVQMAKELDVSRPKLDKLIAENF